MIKSVLVYAVCVIVIWGCDQGLQPAEITSPGFKGKIISLSSIPPADSLLDLRVAAVPYDPTDSSIAAIFRDIFSVPQVIPFTPRTVVLDSLRQASYELSTDERKYVYVAVVQQYGDSIFVNWRVVGIYGYTKAHPSPLPVVVEKGRMRSDIDIYVDFYDMPPQPFRLP
ncbi:MAG: hypothetical protein H3C35_09905 [Bacteroidetes bacterium]|nr:hypothetical protein [Bacteroidota bacterium]